MATGLVRPAFVLLVTFGISAATRTHWRFSASDISLTQDSLAAPWDRLPMPDLSDLPNPFGHKANGDCALHDVDNVNPPTKDKCHIRVYRCSDSRRAELVNHNVGDIGWALSEECYEYGHVLHVYRIEFARAWMYQEPCWDSGDLGICKGGYNMCNRGKYGSVCGCGMHGESCGSDPYRNKTDANNFGWRQIPDMLHPSVGLFGRRLQSCPCYQFSLPKRARGAVDHAKTEHYIENKQWGDRSIDAYYQWNQEGGLLAVDYESCIKKHVLIDGTSLEERIAAFERAVLKGGEKDCTR